ncbi:hypothetical protein EJ110_NYTH10344 [Nymphaea thermarum]|nr:hypothetical protein EJ110_NYTH10344 [Nymphaea thermarum]
MKLAMKDSTTVVPESETPRHTLWISNLDYVAIRVHTSSVYFYRPDGSHIFLRCVGIRIALRVGIWLPFRVFFGVLAVTEQKFFGYGALESKALDPPVDKREKNKRKRNKHV